MSKKTKTTTYGDVLNESSLDNVKKIHNSVAPDVPLDEFLKIACDLMPKLNIGDLVVKPGDTPVNRRAYLVADFNDADNEYCLLSFDSASYEDLDDREYKYVNKFIAEATFHTAHIVEDN